MLAGNELIKKKSAASLDLVTSRLHINHLEITALKLQEQMDEMCLMRQLGKQRLYRSKGLIYNLWLI